MQIKRLFKRSAISIPLLKEGDVIFFKNNSFLSRIIRLAETGKFGQDVPSHVAIVSVLLGNDAVLIEAQGIRVRKGFLSLYKGNKTWFGRLKEPRDIKIGLEWLNEQIGKRYDFKQLIGIWARGLLRILGPKIYEKSRKVKNFLDSRQRFICSELVARYGEITGYRLWNTEISQITPYDLYRSKQVEIFKTDIL